MGGQLGIHFMGMLVECLQNFLVEITPLQVHWSFWLAHLLIKNKTNLNMTNFVSFESFSLSSKIEMLSYPTSDSCFRIVRFL